MVGLVDGTLFTSEVLFRGRNITERLKGGLKGA